MQIRAEHLIQAHKAHASPSIYAHTRKQVLNSPYVETYEDTLLAGECTCFNTRKQMQVQSELLIQATNAGTRSALNSCIRMQMHTQLSIKAYECECTFSPQYKLTSRRTQAHAQVSTLHGQHARSLIGTDTCRHMQNLFNVCMRVQTYNTRL